MHVTTLSSLARMATIAAGTTLLFSSVSLANEGMWRPDQLPEFQSEFDSMEVGINAEEWSDLKSGPLDSMADLSGC